MWAWNRSWLFTKKSITGALIGITVSDRYASITTIRGSSMHPTFSACEVGFSGLLKGIFCGTTILNLIYLVNSSSLIVQPTSS